MVKGLKLSRVMASDELFLGLCVFIAGFVFIGMSGIISPGSEGIMRLLHKTPVIAAVCILFINVSLKMVMHLKSAGAYSREKEYRMLNIFFYLGVVLITAGIIISSLFRFEGKVVLTEGQNFGDDGAGYLEGSVYSGRFSRPPDFKIVMVQVSPSFYKKGRALWNIKANIDYKNRAIRKAIKISSLFPSFADGLFFRADDFGYSPFYRLTMPSGETVDEAYVIMRLFPPGSEDSFRVSPMPHTFYVRYYPDSSMIKESRPTVADEKKGPVYKLRVARNLDLIFNKSVLPNEKVQAGSVFISFDDIRKWAEISIVKDDGLFIIIPGGLIVIAVISWSIWRRVNFFMYKTQSAPDRLQGAE